MMISYLSIGFSRQAIIGYNVPDLFHLIGFAFAGTRMPLPWGSELRLRHKRNTITVIPTEAAGFFLRSRTRAPAGPLACGTRQQQGIPINPLYGRIDSHDF